jgi:hypothetical protein
MIQNREFEMNYPIDKSGHEAVGIIHGFGCQHKTRFIFPHTVEANNEPNNT